MTAAVLLFWCALANAGVVNLRCEYQENPLGIDTTSPRFSWQFESTTRGDKQISAQIIVARSKANIDANSGDMWTATINSRRLRWDESGRR